MRVCARPRPANGRGVDRIGVRGRSDSGLPGARQAGALEDVFDAQASLAGFRRGTKTARNRIQERVDDLNVRMGSGQFRFHPINQFEHILLITAREGERTDRVVHG